LFGVETAKRWFNRTWGQFWWVAFYLNMSFISAASFLIRGPHFEGAGPQGRVAGAVGFFLCVLAVQLALIDFRIASICASNITFWIRLTLVTCLGSLLCLLFQELTPDTVFFAIDIVMVVVIFNLFDALPKELRWLATIPTLSFGALIIVVQLVLINNGYFRGLRPVNETVVVLGTFGGVWHEPLRTDYYSIWTSLNISLATFFIVEITHRWRYRHLGVLATIRIPILGDDDKGWSPHSAVPVAIQRRLPWLVSPSSSNRSMATISVRIAANPDPA
jgi:hypothetical protein